MSEKTDLDRLRGEYTVRQQRLKSSDRYTDGNLSYLFMLQSRGCAVKRMLERNGYTDISCCKILEVGCGTGGVLKEFLLWGANPASLHGIDLLLDRLQIAYQVLSSPLPLTCCNGELLPYALGSFDLVLQYTAFSSILDDSLKQRMAAEMLRVLSPEGMILWYDFWLNPTNAQTRGIRPTEVRHLFPGCKYDFQKIILAPPIARRLVPFSWNLASMVETLGVFNGHYLAAIQPVSG